jgi:hypothetical protein
MERPCVLLLCWGFLGKGRLQRSARDRARVMAEKTERDTLRSTLNSAPQTIQRTLGFTTQCTICQVHPTRIEPGNKKACVTATAQLVPWAKMATVKLAARLRSGMPICCKTETRYCWCPKQNETKEVPSSFCHCQTSCVPACLDMCRNALLSSLPRKFGRDA